MLTLIQIPAPWSYIFTIILFLAALPLIRFIIWKLFSFDRKVRKILEQKKSSEVRLGKITETIAPFLDSFPVDVKKIGTSTVFLGQPVDYIHFDPIEGITFVEVKSGNSRLNENQKRLKELVLKGKVFWEEISVR